MHERPAQQSELTEQNCPSGMQVEQTLPLHDIPEQQSAFVKQLKPSAVQHLFVFGSQLSPSQQPAPQVVPLSLQQKPPLPQMVPPQHCAFELHEENELGHGTHALLTHPFVLSQQSAADPQNSPSNAH